MSEETSDVTVSNQTTRESAERLRGGFNYAQCPDHWQECNDARTLAEAYLAANPADDFEPISKDWLRSVGFEKDGMHLEFCGLRIYFLRSSPLGTFSVKCCFFAVELRHVKTRGEVRRLAAALGITLMEQP